MADKSDRPMNLLLLVPDQWRADYLSCYGHPSINTQHIDRLASEGVRFDRAYCAAPLCGPSRISFVTSLRFSEHGHRNYGSTIDFNVPNLIGTLKQAGYMTAMFGKNHCFHRDQLASIWDRLHEVCWGNYDNHPEYELAHSAFELEQDHPYNTTGLLADEAIDLIEHANPNQPFACWVNWQDPHPAFTCPSPYAEMFDSEDVRLPANYHPDDDITKPHKLNNWRHNSRATEATEDDVRKAIAMYMGQCRYVDDQVGRIREALERTGQLENTLVVFFSDHGELLGDFGVFHKIPTFHECLARVPVIMRYPKREGVTPFVFDGLIEEVDFTPTILEAIGIDVPQSMVGQSWHQPICAQNGDGRDSVLVEAGLQIPTADGPIDGANHRAPFAPNSFGPGAMVTDGRFKLSMYYDDEPEMYDLANDPRETHNLFGAAQLADEQQRLMQLLITRQLGVGVRPAGEWRLPCYDMREHPPEGRTPMRGAGGGQTLKTPWQYHANPKTKE